MAIKDASSSSSIESHKRGWYDIERLQKRKQIFPRADRRRFVFRLAPDGKAPLLPVPAARRRHASLRVFCEAVLFAPRLQRAHAQLLTQQHAISPKRRRTHAPATPRRATYRIEKLRHVVARRVGQDHRTALALLQMLRRSTRRQKGKQQPVASAAAAVRPGKERENLLECASDRRAAAAATKEALNEANGTLQGETVQEEEAGWVHSNVLERAFPPKPSDFQ